MSNTHTTVTNQSWFSRIGQSITGTFIGLLIFLAAFVLLFWNEGRAVKTHKMLQEGAGIVVSVDSGAVDPTNEGKLVHISGKATTSETLTDPVFNVSINAIRLYRKVEMLQWHEIKRSVTTKKVGGGTQTETTTSYKKDWSEELIDSKKFQETSHENPDSMIIESEKWQAENVALGAFNLSSRQIGSIDTKENFALTKENKLKKKIAGKSRFEGGNMYLGSKEHNKVGDFRIQMKVVYPSKVSIVAGQEKSSFMPYKTEVGGSIQMLHTGIKTAAEMFDTAESSNVVLTWLLRIAGFFLMYAGLKMMVRILSVLADVVPLFGNIIGGGTSIVAFLVALVLTLITIAVAWVFYRPIISGILVVVSLGLLFFARSKAKKEAPVAASAQTAEGFGR